jgi:LPXTG-site transpeptidase (sortase) family protein
MQIQGWSTRPGPNLSKRAGGLLRSALAPGIAVLVAGAALALQAPQLVEAVAQGCVTPGNDGPNAALTGVVNTYYPATASAAIGATSISVGPRIAGGSPAIAAGDLLLVVQMQDSDINSTNSIAYGDGTTGRGTTALRSTGLYEYVYAASAVVANVVTIVGSGGGGGLVNAYDEYTGAPVATHGLRTFQVIRVPQYSSATLGAGLTAAPWDGALHAGGVLAVDVAGALNLNAQTISVNQLGFKGALGVQQPGGAGTGTDYAVPTGGGAHGYKAEGTAGTPRFLYDAVGAAAVNAAADGYPTGDAARGAPGTAGGGGTDSHPVANDENTGGGGGANGGQGGLGGNSWNTNLAVGGLGGAAFPAAVTRVVLGGGGGAGTRNNSVAFQSSGGTGGGIVMIRTGSVVGAGTINANGGVGVTPANDGGGGGGAGGSVVVTTNTGTVNGLTINANGGNGTDAWPLGPTGGANYHGPGGGGGGGVIITSNALPLAQTTVAGGLHGTTTPDLAPYGSVNGNAGLILTTTPAAIPGSSSGAECLPVLTAAKTTSTPNVTNTVGGTTAIYSITVSNAANTAAATGVSFSDALPAGFSYASTGGIVLNGGSTRPATVNPVVGDTTPVWGTFSIPASGSVVITFTVNIAASVAPGTYNNPATATYLDPTRTTIAGTTSVNYPGGGVEQVTVHAPDMTITKSHVDPLVRGSTTSTYTLTATNSGNVATSGTVTVTDTLPAGLTPTSAAGAGWTCPAPVGQTITCTRADVLAAGASYPAITVTVTVLQSAAATVTNTTTVSGGGQTNTTNDTASDLTNIVSQADIAVKKTVDNATPNLGTNVTFTVTVTNNGPSTATGVVVNDLLPPGLTFVSATPSTGIYTFGTGVWNVGGLAKGSNATLSLVATMTTPTTKVNTATKTGEVETDPVPGNNSDSATVTLASADIGVVKTANTATPTIGQNVTYTLVVSNFGPSTANGVQLSDPLPATVAFVSYTATQGTYDPVTGIWTVGTMLNGSSVTLALVGRVTAGGNITNTATVLPGSYLDPNLSNNVSAVTVDPLPGLPNTSAPDGMAVAPGPLAAQQIAGLLVVVLTVVAGLGALALAGIGRRRDRSRFGDRRSRSHQRRSPARLAVGLVAMLLSLGIGSMALGQLASYPFAPAAAYSRPGLVAVAVPGPTQLIGGQVVTTAAPAPPKAETFNLVAGPITPSRLRIPSIEVDAQVGAVGLRSDGSMDVPDNLWTSSWLATGPKPGQPGNAVIAAHRGVGSPALFSHLENVRPGDRIYVSDAAGNEIAYAVTAVVSLDLSVSSQREVFAPATAQQLVLITCFGRYINSARTYDHRLVVVGQPLAPAA